MPFDNAAMSLGAAAIIAQLNVMKLHSAPAGGSGTSNVSTAGSQTVSWTTPAGLGNFGLSSPVNFTGGEPSGAVYSFSLWSTDGTFWGEFPMSPTADPKFNGLGQYSVNAADFTGTAT